MKFELEPIGNVNPMPPIDLYGPRPRGLEIEIAPTMAEQIDLRAENERVWGLTKRTAEASNISGAREDCT
jgi:hypothetical protein